MAFGGIRPPFIPSVPEVLVAPKMDAPSIALYVLSVTGLVLFIVVLVFAIISWINAARKKPPTPQETAQASQMQAVQAAGPAPMQAANPF